jgi:hypothetical protein
MQWFKLLRLRWYVGRGYALSSWNRTNHVYGSRHLYYTTNVTLFKGNKFVRITGLRDFGETELDHIEWKGEA